MMLLMSRLSKILLSAILTLSIAAYGYDKATIESFIKKYVVINPKVKFQSLEVIEAQKVPGHSQWEAVFVVMSLEFQGKEMKIPETVFVSGDLATMQLIDIKNGKNFKAELRPAVPQSMYQKSHLLYGNEDAKHKIIVFSDPMCPFCRQSVPKLIEAAKKHPETIALYYYHLPLLQIHPVSGPLTRIMHVAQSEGRNDVIEKIYTIDLPFRETDMSKILQTVQKHTGYSITAAKVNAKEVKEAIKKDEEAAARLMVRGTPTIFIDGKLDKTREGYKALLP